jgi:hypothetical protein
MFYALAVFVLASPVILAVVLTSHISRRAKVLIVAGYALFLVVFPIAAVALGAGAGV